MNKPLLALLGLLLLYPTSAFGSAYIKIDSIEGESSATQTPSRVAVPSASATPQEASTDFLIKLPGVDGESDDPTPTPTPQKGQSQAIEPDEIDVGDDGEPLTPDFGILLGGGNDADDEDGVPSITEDGRIAAAQILLDGAKDLHAPVEAVKVTQSKIEAITIKQGVKLFGFIKLNAQPTVVISQEGALSVRFPWWTFFATGKDDSVGDTVFRAISSVMKTKHDTLKSSVGNIR